MEPGSETGIPKLPLENMADRHIGLTPSLAGSFLEAARVCLDRHHRSPTDFDYQNDQEEGITTVRWEVTDKRTRDAYNNESEATRDGAYIFALAALEMMSGLVAVRRAENQTGADYYVAPIGETSEDLEGCWRLEVKGTDQSKVRMRSKLKEAVTQLLAGDSNLPAIAAVIGFRERLIILMTVEESI
jgi:hypothetical protein